MPELGAWYAAAEVRTAAAEVGHLDLHDGPPVDLGQARPGVRDKPLVAQGDRVRDQMVPPCQRRHVLVIGPTAAADDPDAEWSRVQEERVVLVGRLSLFGQGASRLHDSLVHAVAELREPGSVPPGCADHDCS